MRTGKQKKVRDEWNQPIDVVDIFDETVTPDIVDSGVESFKALERIPVPGNMQGHGKNWRTVLVRGPALRFKAPACVVCRESHLLLHVTGLAGRNSSQEMYTAHHVSFNARPH